MRATQVAANFAIDSGNAVAVRMERRTRIQPIAIRDVLTDLIACLDTPETAGRTIEIGGPDVLPYAELIGDPNAEARLRQFAQRVYEITRPALLA